MISCGLQCITCDYPVHMDTYVGCSHNCKYCFTAGKSKKIARNMANIKPLPNVKGVRDFINGKRNLETMCFNWDIPLHWGANSDPFQECERDHKASLDVLKVFAETKYPFMVSTKNPVLLTEEPYLSLVSECECIIQISMACSKYDALEPGAPKFEERLKAAEILSKHVTRVVARVQPYMVNCKKDIIAELPRMKQAGIHGIIISSYFSSTKQKGMVKMGAKYHFPDDVLARDFKQIKEACKENGLAFTCAEDGLSWLSDDIKCCGTIGLDQYHPTPFTLDRIAYTPETAIPNEVMKQVGTTRPFKSWKATQAWALKLKTQSYYDVMMSIEPLHTEYCRNNMKKYGSD